MILQVNAGINSSLSQCSQKLGKCNTTNSYGKEALKSVIEHTHNNEDTSKIIISQDICQNIFLSEVQEFYSNLDMRNIPQMLNNISIKDLNCACATRLKFIGTIATTQEIINYAEEQELHDKYEITDANYRAYAAEISKNVL